MVSAKETAEEQLLRMIEGPAGPSSPRGPLKKFSVEQVTEQIRSRVGLLWRWALPAGASHEHADAFLWRLRIAERVFWGVIGTLAIYLVVDLAMLKRRPPMISVRPSTHAVVASSAPEASAPAEERLKSLAEYREALATRNPFGLSPIGGGGAGNAKAKSHLTDLVAPLVVVGINRGRVPEALIEDSQDQHTHFVKVGDEINGLKISAIDERGVTLSYEGEETILH